MFRLAWTPLTLVTQTSTLDKGETGMGITFKGKKKKDYCSETLATDSTSEARYSIRGTLKN